MDTVTLVTVVHGKVIAEGRPDQQLRVSAATSTSGFGCNIVDDIEAVAVVVDRSLTDGTGSGSATARGGTRALMGGSASEVRPGVVVPGLAPAENPGSADRAGESAELKFRQGLVVRLRRPG